LAVFCERCAAEREPRAASGLLCPDCGGACPTIVRGRELQLVAMEVPQ
jgi:Zn finger protein HypA/HybF involved in hydrogenase expression